MALAAEPWKSSMNNGMELWLLTSVPARLLRKYPPKFLVRKCYVTMFERFWAVANAIQPGAGMHSLLPRIKFGL